MDIDCKHKRLEECEGYIFCVECGMEIDQFYGYSYKGFKKKIKNYHCDKCDKYFLKDSGLKRHLKNHF